MTTIEPAIHAGDRSLALGMAAAPTVSVPRHFMIGGILIAAVGGLVSGMAYANSLFFPIGFITLLLWAFGGGVMGALGGGIVGFVVDRLVAQLRHA